MATAAPTYCRAYPCGEKVTEGSYCAQHRQAARQQERRHYTGTPGLNYGRPWRRHRARYLAAHPYCVDCGGVLDLEVDHQVPHEGDAVLFWDESNWRTRCKRCHSTKTARELARR